MKRKLSAPARSSIVARAKKYPRVQNTIPYLYQVLRGFRRSRFLRKRCWDSRSFPADLASSASTDVMPEDGATSMADYALHMKMVGFLHGLYPKVHISLHAGELAPAWSRPKAAGCHIRLAVEEAHAERIGHGVRVMHEDRPYELLKEKWPRNT